MIMTFFIGCCIKEIDLEEDHRCSSHNSKLRTNKVISNSTKPNEDNEEIRKVSMLCELYYFALLNTVLVSIYL